MVKSDLADREERKALILTLTGLEHAEAEYQAGERVHAGAVGSGGMGNHLVKKGGTLRERFEYMMQTKGISRKKALVAIARRLGALRYTL